MSWLKKLLPPRIRTEAPASKRSVPEGLWDKCDRCGAVLYRPDLEKNLNVCPKCSHHSRIGARARLDAFLDAGRTLRDRRRARPGRRAEVQGQKKYPERLKAAQKPPARPTRWS